MQVWRRYTLCLWTVLLAVGLMPLPVKAAAQPDWKAEVSFNCQIVQPVDFCGGEPVFRISNSLVFYGDGTGHDEDGIIFHYVAGDLKNPVPLPWCNVPGAAVDCKLKGAYRWHTDYTWHYAPDQADPTKTAIWIDRTEVTYHGTGSQPVTVVDPVFPVGGPASRDPYPFEVGVPTVGHASPDFIFTPIGPLPAQPGFKIEMTWHQLPAGV